MAGLESALRFRSAATFPESHAVGFGVACAPSAARVDSLLRYRFVGGEGGEGGEQHLHQFAAAMSVGRVSDWQMHPMPKACIPVAHSPSTIGTSLSVYLSEVRSIASGHFIGALSAGTPGRVRRDDWQQNVAMASGVGLCLMVGAARPPNEFAQHDGAVQTAGAVAFRMMGERAGRSAATRRLLRLLRGAPRTDRGISMMRQD